MTGRWCSPGTPVSSTNKTDCHDITEILLKVALSTIKPALLGYNMFSGRLSKVENKKWMMVLIVCFFTCDCNTRNFIYLDLKHVSHPTEKLKPIIFIIPSLPDGGILFYLCPSIRPRHFSQQLSMAEIWCLVTSVIYVYHIVGSVFGPVRFLLPVCRLSWFLYTLNIYAHFSSHFSQQLLVAEIWYLVTSFI